MDTREIVEKQRAFFFTDATKPYQFRIDALRRLYAAIQKNERKIMGALEADMGKSDFEAYMTEVGIVLDELRNTIKRLKGWMKPKRVPTPLSQFPSKSFVLSEPFGVALIMSPWNYPFQLTMVPVVAALCAGNCIVVKPSNYSPATSQAIADLLHLCFPPEYAEVVMGGREQNQDLLKQQFDYIFFTGGVNVGKTVLEAAAQHVTPVTLELGGKSPCIVDKSADIPLAAKRIAFGKFINSGQTCVAPDYILVHHSKKGELVAALQKAIIELYGADALQNPDFPRIVNNKHFHRLLGLMEGATTAFGGQSDEAARRIAPTILTDVTWESPVMGEEIFGPLLPILEFESIEDVASTVNAHPKPLALYLFTTDAAVEERVLRSISYGGGCINDTIIHLANHDLPFGGVGHSGMGHYHGKMSFDTFSHKKGVLKKANWLDLPMRYPPFTAKNFKAIRKFIH